MIKQYKLVCDNPQQRSKDIAESRGRDGKRTVYAYPFVDNFLIVNDGDYEGLTLDEIKQLTEYTPPDVEVNI